MLVEAINGIAYSSVLFSLILIDYVLGNGFVDMSRMFFCKIACFVKKTLRDEAKLVPMSASDTPISLPVLFTEIAMLAFTIAILNRYKQYRGKDNIDELLQESKVALRQTNEFLEKWRLRKINWQVPTEYSYLDEEPQEIKPLRLEVPILHMAIIDTLGTTRSQPESGDAGDTINFTDSTLLSVTSLLDDDLESSQEQSSEEKLPENTIDFNHRSLWDVMEEDSNSLEEI